MMTQPLIKGSRFRYCPKPGTGNKSTPVAQKEKVRLANIIIENAEARAFMEVLYGTGENEIRVEMSNRRTSRQWGSAWMLQRRVVIYRHTVWVFLHELAHILDVKRDFTGRTIQANRPHGRDFGLCLKTLYDLWMEFLDTGKQVETETAEDRPNLDQDYFKFTEPPAKYRVPQLRPRTVGGISLQVGDAVWFRHKGLKHYGKVTKVNRVNCKVSTDEGNWRVNPKLLNKV